MNIMSVVIFNGGRKEQTQLNSIQEELEKELMQNNLRSISYVMNQIEIISCTGCFRCWDTTPGICSGVSSDRGEEIKKEVVNSNLLVFLTPITFGGYSSDLKKIVERLLGTLQPGIQLVKGESHHKKRYDTYPSFLAIGISENNDREEEELFKTLVYRHSLNFYPPVVKTHIIQKNEEISSERIKDMIKEMELVE